MHHVYCKKTLIILSFDRHFAFFVVFRVIQTRKKISAPNPTFCIFAIFRVTRTRKEISNPNPIAIVWFFLNSNYIRRIREMHVTRKASLNITFCIMFMLIFIVVHMQWVIVSYCMYFLICFAIVLSHCF